MGSLTFVPFDAFWILTAALLVTTARLRALLREDHPETWHRLGRPRFLPRGDLGARSALTGFYWSWRVAALGDARLRRWAIALRVEQVLLATVLALLWGSFLS